MVRVAHFTRFLGTAGLEQMIVELCRARDRRRFEFLVAAPLDDGRGPELREAGARGIVDPGAFEQAAASADLVNVHLCELRYSAELLPTVMRTGKPWLATLHDRITFPEDLPAVAICTAQHCRRIQSPRTRCITIPNGVDVDRFARPARPPRDEVVITRVCRAPKCAPYFWEVVGR